MESLGSRYGERRPPPNCGTGRASRLLGFCNRAAQKTRASCPGLATYPFWALFCAALPSSEKRLTSSSSSRRGSLDQLGLAKSWQLPWTIASPATIGRSFCAVSWRCLRPSPNLSSGISSITFLSSRAVGRRGSPMERSNFWVLFSATTLALSLASGCTSDQLYDHRAHTDKVTEGAGNASAANRAIHTIDPWPAYSEKTEINTDGKRALVAVRRYETNTSVKPADTSTNGNGAGKN